MSIPPQQPPPVTGPEAGRAKPAAPGPTEPKGIAASILPQRRRDAARHPEGDARPSDGARDADDVAAGEEQAAEAAPAERGR